MIPYHSELLLQCINSVSSLNPTEEWSNIVVLNFQTYIIINMIIHSFGIKSMIYIYYMVVTYMRQLYILVLAGNDMDVNEPERLSNITFGYKLK